MISMSHFCRTVNRHFLHRNQHHHRNHHRSLHDTRSLLISTSISVNKALRLLQLQHNPDFTPNELRDAYFKSAKLCHPDSSSANRKGDDEACTLQFLEITEAYELLGRRKGGANGVMDRNRNDSGANDDYSHTDDDFIIHRSAEEQFRIACREHLGLDAETVEESKRCPLFREWLKGKTDASFHWNNFFMKNGGLAPMLNPKKVHRLSQGNLDRDGYGNTRTKVRRRRKRSGKKT
mmetsp:Transcript_6839/g.8525  ORF Transcript_6839/g.8525 Transcript_6839/m.8525 type:complete len:235 (+) Transcript_6839:121-825(+)